MTNIITDINSLKEETLLNLKSSKSYNTTRAYKSDFNDFSLFCAQNGFKTLPSEPKIVSLYLTQLSTKNVKISTIKRRLVSIGVVHKLKGHYLDTKHPSIIENIMGIRRRKGSAQKGKKPILINDLKQIINVIDKENNEEIKKSRDRSIILIGFMRMKDEIHHISHRIFRKPMIHYMFGILLVYRLTWMILNIIHMQKLFSHGTCMSLMKLIVLSCILVIILLICVHSQVIR